MRTLRVVCGLVGLVLGIAAAVIWHYSQYRLGPLQYPRGGWFSYTPGPPKVRYRAHPGIWPSALVLPIAGLAAGLIAGLLLGRSGWRLDRTPPTGSPAGA